MLLLLFWYWFGACWLLLVSRPGNRPLFIPSKRIQGKYPKFQCCFPANLKYRCQEDNREIMYLVTRKILIIEHKDLCALDHTYNRGMISQDILR